MPISLMQFVQAQVYQTFIKNLLLNLKTLPMQVVVFVGHSPSGEKPYARIYTRLGNPNTEYLEKVLFQLRVSAYN